MKLKELSVLSLVCCMRLESRIADCRFSSLEVALWALAKLTFYLQYLYTYGINCSKELFQETKEADKEPKRIKLFFSA